MATKQNIKKSNVILGKNIERMRIAKNMTRMQLGSIINQTLQQVQRYESGEAFISLPVLEKIASAFDEPVAKKIIRRISIARKLEVETDTEMTDELIDLYHQVFPEDILE